MKKKVSIIILIAAVAALTACGVKQNSENTTAKDKTTLAPKATEAPEATSAPEPTEVPAATATPEAVSTPVATEKPAATEAPKATEAPAATPTPETAIRPVLTNAPDEVSQIPNEEKVETYLLFGESLGSFVSIDLDRETKVCSVTTNSDAPVTGTFEENGEEVILSIEGNKIIFQKVDNSLVHVNVKEEKNAITSKFNGGTVFRKVSDARKSLKEKAGLMPDGDPLEVESYVVRTNGYVDGVKYPRTVVITSRAELDKYYELYNGTYNLGSPASGENSFIKLCEKYNDAYFAEKNLVLIVLESGTGMVSYSVRGAFYSENALSVYIDVTAPEVATADMAEWHVILETSKTVKAGDDISVKLTSGTVDGFSPSEKIGSKKK